MTYRQQLVSEEWQDKRIEILNRDHHQCIHCFNEEYFHNSEECEAQLLEEQQGYYIYRLSKNNLSYIKASSGHRQTIPFLAYFIADRARPGRNYIIAGRLADDYDKVASTRKMIPKDVSLIIREAVIRAFSIRENVSVEAFSETRDFSKTKWLFVDGLHVHHTFYQKGRLPWNYPNDSLQTLCWICHEQLHKNQKIPRKDASGKIIGDVTPCKRCNGTGWFPEFSHVQKGICFRCKGARYEELFQH